MTKDEATFRASIAARVTGMNVNSIRHLRYKSPIVLERATGCWSRFTFNDLVALSCLGQLLQNGFLVKDAGEIANFAGRAYRDAVAPQSVEMPGHVLAVQWGEGENKGRVQVHKLEHDDNPFSRLMEVCDDAIIVRSCVLDLALIERVLGARIRSLPVQAR